MQTFKIIFLQSVNYLYMIIYAIGCFMYCCFIYYSVGLLNFKSHGLLTFVFKYCNKFVHFKQSRDLSINYDKEYTYCNQW